jgi:eukaryotic-like serine/threonine-protein kinase
MIAFLSISSKSMGHYTIVHADKSVSKQTSALGTPGYAPSEQYQGNTDQRSDLYALAATLHHLLTNRDPRDYPPFNYPPVRSLNPQLSPQIERVLEHALKINVNERYQNATAMIHDIDEILTQRFGVGNTSIYTFGTFRSSGT